MEQSQPSTQGDAAKGDLGIELRELSEQTIKALKLSQENALLVVLPLPSGPGEQSGLRTGDIILGVGKTPVRDQDSFLALINKLKPGQEIALRIIRQKRPLVVPVRIDSSSRREETFAKLKAEELKEREISANVYLLSLLPRESFPEDWAATQNNLGNAFRTRITGSRAENIEAAIKAYEAALTVYTRNAFPQEWARTQNNLGNAFRTRITGSRAENIEAAIKAYEAALTVFTRDASPYDWAGIQTNRGVTYRDRIEGGRAENIEAAIKAYEAALTVYTREAFPYDWAANQINLGATYADRIEGDRMDNIEAAIKAYEAALTVYTREAFPQEWAWTQTNLGAAYAYRTRGSRAENIEAAIKAYEAALIIANREAFPQPWARTQNNLGDAFRTLITGSRAENIEAAIKAYEAALTVFTRDAFPEDWARTQNNLGAAYADRIEGSKAQNVEAAIKAYEAALTVYTRDAFPRENLRTSRLIASIFMARGDWPHALSKLSIARDAFLILFGGGGEEALISDSGSLFADLAYAETATGNAKAALGTFSEGRAIMLGEALREQERFLKLTPFQKVEYQAVLTQIRGFKRLAEAAGSEGTEAINYLREAQGKLAELSGPRLALTPDEGVEYQKLRTEIREWEKLAKAKAGSDSAEALGHLIEARDNLNSLVTGAFTKSAGEAVIDKIARQGLMKDGALVAPIITDVGSKFLVVTVRDGALCVSSIEYPDLTANTLKALLHQPDQPGQSAGWLVAYNIKTIRPGYWLHAIETIGPKLWSLFAGTLDKELKMAGVKDGARIIFLPEGALGLLPLDLARDEVSGRSFADAYEILNVPSLEAYLAAARTAANSQAPSLAEAINPTGDIPELNLPFADIEGKIVASHFKGKPLIRFDSMNAEPDVVLTGLKGKSYWHFSAHGAFDWSDARETGLLMKDRKKLTVGALLDQRGILEEPRLVVLSACETGLYDPDKNPDEFVGLPATFLELGAGGVIGSLWEVDDLATAFLMAKFYDLHLEQGLEPAAALKQAKAWLKNATRRQLMEFGDAKAKRAKLDPALFTKLKTDLMPRIRGDQTRSAAIWNLLQEKVAAATKAVRSYFRNRFDQNSRPFAHPYYWSGFIYTGS